MRVLMVAPEPFFEPRGTPISVYQRLTAVSALEHEVDILTYHLGSNVNLPCVQLHRIPSIPFIKKVVIGPSWSKLLLDTLLFFKTVRMLVSKQYDVIHSHEEAAFFTFFLASLFRISHLYDMHSSLPRQLANSKFGFLKPVVRVFEILEKLVIKHSDAVITIGADLEEDVQRINPYVPHMLIENLALNSHTTRDPAGNNKLNFGFVLDGRLPVVYTGSFEAYQGLDLLLESAAIVRDRFENVVYILVGGKPEQIELYREKVRKFQLEQHVHFVGTIPPEEALAFLEIAEVLVSPRIDGMSVPLKIYTYLLSGKPCVATRMPAHTQVLNDEIALLVEPTKEAFAEGILQVLQDPDQSRRLGMRAQQYAQEKYNFRDYTDKVDMIYHLLKPVYYHPEKAAGLAKE